MSRGYAGNGALGAIGRRPDVVAGLIGGAVGPEATVADVRVLAERGRGPGITGPLLPGETTIGRKVVDLPSGQS